MPSTTRTPGRLALLFAAALLVGACAEDDAPTTDELEERAADMETPTDAASPPLELAPPEDPAGDAEPEPSGATPAVQVPPPPTPQPEPLEPERPATPTPAPDAETSAPDAPQPDAGGTAPAAQAEALWARFRQAVASRDASAIETLIADPVLLNGQPVPHAEFAEMTPGGSVSDFITTFEGELSPGDELTVAADGGYTALAVARNEETESALVFRLAPDADGTWRIVAIDAAG